MLEYSDVASDELVWLDLWLRRVHAEGDEVSDSQLHTLGSCQEAALVLDVAVGPA